MKVLAIDPGTEKSAYVLWDGKKPLEFAILPNEEVLQKVGAFALPNPRTGERAMLVIEKIESFGMAVGVETFTTVHWAGRFHQHWNDVGGKREVALLGRKAIKLHLCNSVKAKDANIRQALIDRYGAVGTKKQPGALFGIASHLWAALAVAVTHYDEMGGCLE